MQGTYTCHEDPGHGWLQVPHADIAALGVEITPYSYQKGAYAYLEEDCDAPAFMQARTDAGHADPEIEHVLHRVMDSPVRRYASYRETVRS